MGLSNTGGNSKFVTINGGKFTIRLKDDDPNPKAVERVLGEKSPNAGKTIKELKFNHIDGKIVSAEMKEGKYGTDMCFDIDDGKEPVKLQVNLDSGFFGQVTKRLPNLNKDEWLDIFIGTDSETKRPFIWIEQGGSTVKMAHTRDNPNGMPERVEKVVKGKTEYDYTDQENFLYNVACEFIDKVNGGVSAPPAEPTEDDTVPF